MKLCNVCSRPLTLDGPSQTRCPDHLNEPSKAEREILRRSASDRAAEFAAIRQKHGV